MRARPSSGKRKVVVITAEEEQWEEAMPLAGAAALDRLEAEVVFMVVASTQQARRSVVRADPLEWERAEAELASACRATLHLERVRYIGGRSIIMDELADP